MRAVHWFRSDLRLEDNTALAAACAHADELVPLFVVDPHLFGELSDTGRRPYSRISPRRANFLLESLAEMGEQLAAAGCPLVLRLGDPAVEVARLLDETRADLLTFNRDYSPYARRRDAKVFAAAGARGTRVGDYKDRVVFESDEVRTRAGGPFHVYSPFMRAWRAELARRPLEKPPGLRLPRPVSGLASAALPALRPGSGEPMTRGGARAAQRRLRRFLSESIGDYAARRDLPGVDGTSRLSPHLRFGTLSIRECVRSALALIERTDRRGADGAVRNTVAASAEKWVDELIWREFYQALLAEHPRVLGGAFRREYDSVSWNDDEAGFVAWCAGRTGYPIVDAGMRQLALSGWMHNRARMVVASFLVKDLLVDWRRGEAFFMQHLLDGDPASNNGGWQWSASTGTDAQPYFRVFSPVSQGERFDPEGIYVRRFLPELNDVPDKFLHRPWEAPSPPEHYPPPIVDHAERRIVAVARFAAAKQKRRTEG
jgi:deoxyribodipyrimidine photo-lyase